MGIIYAVFTITVSVAGFLFTHFDVVNSMLMGGLSQFFARNYEWSISSRWILFFVVFMVCEIIQHSSQISRILFTVFSVYVAGMLSTVFMPRDTRPEAIKIEVIWMLVALVLNFIRWSIIKGQMQDYN